MRSRQVSLPATALAHHAGIVASRAPGGRGRCPAARRPRRASAPSCPRAGGATRPSPFAVGRGRRRRRPVRRRRCRPGCRASTPTTHAGARRRDDGLHLHRADDQQAVAGLRRDRPRRPGPRPRCRPSGFARPARRRRPPASARRRSPTAAVGAGASPLASPAARGTPAGPRSAATPRRRRPARAPRRAASCGRRRRGPRDGPGWPAAAAGWSAGRRCGTRRRRGACGRRRRPRTTSRRRADDLGQQRIELRRRRVAEVAAGIDPHAGPGRLLVGGERAGAGRHDPRLHGEAARVADGLPGRRGRASASDSPAAMRNWASTRSMPVTCSVTVCSTWMRGLHSMKKCSPVSGTTRNSTVPAFT